MNRIKRHVSYVKNTKAGTTARDRAIKRMYEGGLGRKEIRSDLGLTKGQLDAAIHRMGLKKRGAK